MCVCVSAFINFWMSEPVGMKIRTYIMATEHISAATSQIRPISLCVCIPPIVARQRLGKHVTVATNTRNVRRILGHAVA
jgi:hypothetical protein